MDPSRYTFGFDHAAINVPEAQEQNCYAAYEPLDDRLGLTNAYVPPPSCDPDELAIQFGLRQQFYNTAASDAFRTGARGGHFPRRAADFDAEAMKESLFQEKSLRVRQNSHYHRIREDDPPPALAPYQTDPTSSYLYHSTGLSPTKALLNSAHYEIEYPYEGPLIVEHDPRSVEPGALASEQAGRAAMAKRVSRNTKARGEKAPETPKRTPLKKKSAGTRQKAAVLDDPSPTKPKPRGRPKKVTFTDVKVTK